MMTQTGTKPPLVSVIMPAYNAEAHIAEAIGSVLAQTEGNWELLVIDDHSTDRTRETVAHFSGMDPRIHLLMNEGDRGTAFARNHGFENCRGMYVALLDSDDVWYPTKLEKQLAYMEKTGAYLVCSSYFLLDGVQKGRCRRYTVPETIDLEILLRENVIGCSTVLLRRELAERFRFTGVYRHEDYALWLEILRSGYRAAGVREVLAGYRIHRESRNRNKLAAAANRWIIYRSLMKLPMGKCVRYMIWYALGGMRKYYG